MEKICTNCGVQFMDHEDEFNTCENCGLVLMVICPGCTCNISQDEARMFDGQCEECNELPMI